MVRELPGGALMLGNERMALDRGLWRIIKLIVVEILIRSKTGVPIGHLQVEEAFRTNPSVGFSFPEPMNPLSYRSRCDFFFDKLSYSLVLLIRPF